MVLDTDLPENLTAVPAGHGKLQRVMVGILLGGYSDKHKHRKQKEKRRGKKRKETLHELTVGSALSLIRNLLRLKLSLRILDQLKELIFVFPWIQKNQNQLRQHKQKRKTKNYQAVHSFPDELGGGLPQNVRNQLTDLSYQLNFKRSQHSLKMCRKIRAVKQRRLDLIGVSLVKRECIHCSMACFVCYVWECQVRAPLKKKNQTLPELQPSSSNHQLIAVPNISVLWVEKTFHLELRILW